MLRPLSQFVSAHIVPKCRDIFGQLLGGELVIRGFLFEISCPDGRADWQHRLDDGHKTELNTTLYFLPLAELKLRQLPQPRTFAGLFIKAVDNATEPRKFGRVGSIDFDESGGRKFLAADSWERLLNLPSPGEWGEELLLV